MTTAEVSHAYLEKTTNDLDAVLADKERCLKLISGGMARYHTLCNQEACIRLKIDHQLDEYFPVMEPLDGMGSE